MSGNRILKNIGFLYFKMGITIFLSLYTTRIVLNALGVIDFGIYNVVGGVIALLGFINNSMSSVTQRFMSFAEGEGNLDKKRTVFNVSVLLHLIIGIIACIVFICAENTLFSYVLNIPYDRIYAAKTVYVGLIVSTVFSMLSVPYEALINSHEDMGYYAIVGIIEATLKLIVAFIITYCSSEKLIVYGIIMPLVTIISMIIMRVYCHRNYKECTINLFHFIKWDVFKAMCKFSGWNLLGVSSSMGGYYGGTIVLNHYFGATINAASAIATQINSQLQSLASNMLKAVNPVIAINEGSGNRNAMTILSLRSCKYSYFLFALLAIPFYIEMPAILLTWLGHVPDWAIIFTRLSIIKNLVEQTTLVLSTSILAMGNISKYNVLMAIINVLPLAIVVILFSRQNTPDYLYIFQIIFYGAVACLLKIYLMKKYSGANLSEFFKIVFIPIIKVSALSVIACVILSHMVSSVYLSVFLMIIVVMLSIIFVGATIDERIYISKKVTVLILHIHDKISKR